MPTLLQFGAAMAFTIESLIKHVGAELGITLPVNQPWFCITEQADLLRQLKRYGNDSAVILTNQMVIRHIPQHEFMSHSTSFIKGGYLYQIKGRITYAGTPCIQLMVGVGPTDFCAMVHSLIPTGETAPLVSVDQHTVAERAPVAPITLFAAVESPEYCAYETDENLLYATLKDLTLPLPDRILTALINMFPYIKEQARNFIKIARRYDSALLADDAAAQGLETGVLLREGEAFSLLVLFVLGPAYSQRTRLPDQIYKRAKAAAAQGNFRHLTSAGTTDLCQSVNWECGDLPPVLFEILGMVICRRQDGSYSPDSRLGDLISTEAARATLHITEQAMTILEQARLVYTNFQSSSLHFILPIVPLLLSTIGVDNAEYAIEQARFDQIIDIVRNAPYRGLRQTIPERQQIKQFPRLVYTGLLYHKRVVKGSPEEATFADYKVEEIKNHLPTQHAKSAVENVVELLPPPTIAALAALIKGLGIDHAQRLMATRTEKERAEVLEMLRGDEAPGAWALDQLSRESAAYQRLIIGKGVELLRTALQARFEGVRTVADSQLDRDVRARMIEEAVSWKNRVEEAIAALSPWTEALPDAPRTSQRVIKDRVTNQLTDVMTMVRLGPTTPPAPAVEMDQQ